MPFHFIDLPSPADSLLDDVLRGLAADPKSIPPKYFYDAAGARLFEAICRLPEYYLTRTEQALLAERLPEMAAVLGPVDCIIEPGAGGCDKIRALVATLAPREVALLDISGEHLRQAGGRLAADHPGLTVTAACMDFIHGLDGLAPHLPAGRRLVFYPGSSIGNFTPGEAVDLLGAFRNLAGPDGGLLIGFDCLKEASVLHRAYNDAQGITAAFNLNLLARINRELAADFDLEGFRHHAFLNAEEGRIEMHLVSRRAQAVRVAGHVFRFGAGEGLHTENSYKHRSEDFIRLADRAGWRLAGQWQDAAGWFALQALRAAAR